MPWGRKALSKPTTWVVLSPPMVKLVSFQDVLLKVADSKNLRMKDEDGWKSSQAKMHFKNSAQTKVSRWHFRHIYAGNTHGKCGERAPCHWQEWHAKETDCSWCYMTQNVLQKYTEHSRNNSREGNIHISWQWIHVSRILGDQIPSDVQT